MSVAMTKARKNFWKIIQLPPRMFQRLGLEVEVERGERTSSISLVNSKFQHAYVKYSAPRIFLQVCNFLFNLYDIAEFLFNSTEIFRGIHTFVLLSRSCFTAVLCFVNGNMAEPRTGSAGLVRVFRPVIFVMLQFYWYSKTDCQVPWWTQTIPSPPQCVHCCRVHPT